MTPDILNHHTTHINNNNDDPDDDFIFYDEEENEIYQLTESSLIVPPFILTTTPCPRITLPLTIYLWTTTCSSNSLDENALHHIYSMYSQGVLDGIYLARKLSSPDDLLSSGLFDEDDDDDNVHDFCQTLSVISCIRHSFLHFPSHHILFLETKSSSSSSSLHDLSTDIYRAFQTFINSSENVSCDDRHIFLKNHVIQEIVETYINDLQHVLNDLYPSLLHK